MKLTDGETVDLIAGAHALMMEAHNQHIKMFNFDIRNKFDKEGITTGDVFYATGINPETTTSETTAVLREHNWKKHDDKQCWTFSVNRR